MASGFLSLISHGWVVTFQDSHRTIFTFRSWLDLLGVVLTFNFWISIQKISKLLQNCWHRVIKLLDFHSKNLKITSKLLTQGYRYHILRKTFGKFFRSYSELLSKFGDISFQEYLSKGISHPGVYGDLVYKLRRVRDTLNFISSGSKNSQTPSTTTVWPSDHREDYRSCDWSFCSLVQTFPKALHSD